MTITIPVWALWTCGVLAVGIVGLVVGGVLAAWFMAWQTFRNYK